MKPNTRFYFETSAVNYIADMIFNNPDFGSLATRKLQIEKGRKWQISNVALWEIFLTKDEDRRYYLFDLSRCLFYEKLISSPEEIIINYIISGCPRIEKQYELDSKGTFSAEWTKACNNLDFAFHPDNKQLEDITNHFRFIGEYFVKSAKGYRLVSVKEIDHFSDKIDGAFLKSSYNRLLEQAGHPVDESFMEFIGFSMQVVLLILCYGIGFDHLTIENYWNKSRKIEPLERLSIAIEKFPAIFFRGPLANITKMMILQSNNKTGRGMYFDSLQSIYTTYSDIFLTNDNHFLKYKSEHNNDPNMVKVISIKELNFFTPA